MLKMASERGLGRLALLLLAVTLGLMLIMWAAWDHIGEGKREQGLEAQVEQGAPLRGGRPEVLPPTTNPTGQTGGTPADEDPPPAERPVSNND